MDPSQSQLVSRGQPDYLWTPLVIYAAPPKLVHTILICNECWGVSSVSEDCFRYRNSQNTTKWEFSLTPPPMTRAVRGTTRFLWSLAGAAQRKTPRLAKPPPAARSALDMASVRNNPRFETRRRLKRPKCYNSLIYGHVMASTYTLVCFISKNKFCCLELFDQENQDASTSSISSVPDLLMTQLT